MKEELMMNTARALKEYCKGREICEGCVFYEERWDCKVGTSEKIPADWDLPESVELIQEYDEEEIHENCTVQILRNSVTGETSIGWYENK